MFRSVAALLFLVSSLALGLGSTYWLVDKGVDVGVLRAGPWVANLRAANDPDPYVRAHLAKTGEVALALAEGIRLVATSDDELQPLTGKCRYSVSGNTPQSRYWSLTVANINGEFPENEFHRLGFTSSELLRDQSGKWRIALSPTVQPGNWQPVQAGKPFVLMLHLYEPAILGGTSTIERDRLPHIIREDCP